jgi:hypothetical protein
MYTYVVYMHILMGRVYREFFLNWCCGSLCFVGDVDSNVAINAVLPRCVFYNVPNTALLKGLDSKSHIFNTSAALLQYVP